jgi:hypothetical protein
VAQQYGTGGGITVKMAGPFGGGGGGSGTSARITEISLPVNAWKGGESPYSQVVDVDVITIRSQVNLQLSVEQTQKICNDGFALTAENNEGAVTVYAIGNKPTEDYTIQATVTEVLA